jgi:hypothetical protein
MPKKPPAPPAVRSSALDPAAWGIAAATLLARYSRWLHTRWPAGTVERLPESSEDGSTNVPGLYVAGDLTGVPLLKFSADSGARVVRTILADPSFRARERRPGGPIAHDLAILGAGVAGMAAALEARGAGLDFVLLEATEPFSTIVNLPKAKPIYTYPTEMTPTGSLRISAGGPSAILLPDSSTTTRLHRFMMNSTLCSTMTKVTPSALSFRITCSMRRIIVGLTPATGSSRTTTFGRAIMLEAMARSLRCP